MKQSVLALLVFGGLTAYAHRIVTKAVVYKVALAATGKGENKSFPVEPSDANPAADNVVIETRSTLAMEPAQSGGGLNLNQSVVSGGGGTSAGGSLSLSGSVGQASAGVSTGGTLSLSGGFWSGSGACQPIPILPTTLVEGRAGAA